MQWIYFEKNEFLVHIKYIGVIFLFLLSYNMHIVAMTQLEKFVMFTSSEIAFQNNVLEAEKNALECVQGDSAEWLYRSAEELNFFFCFAF